MIGAFIAAMAVLSTGATGCAAETDDVEQGSDEGDVGETAEALSTSCSISRSSILQSVAGARKEAIQRGFSWLDAGVSYSQSRSYQGYRTDCSGFVSMCWKTGTSYTTLSYSQGVASSVISYAALKPGDALVRRSNGSGHIVLFLGWNDAAKTSACVLEQASTALDMEFRSRSASSLRSGGYKAIRADKF